jgi:hypothetical protein
LTRADAKAEDEAHADGADEESRAEDEQAGEQRQSLLQNDSPAGDRCHQEQVENAVLLFAGRRPGAVPDAVHQERSRSP